MAPKVAGRLEKILVDVGDRVKQEQLITVLDSDEYVQQVDQARAELEVARANLEETRSALDIAKRELERIKALRQKEIASESDLDEAGAEFSREKVEGTTAGLSQARYSSLDMGVGASKHFPTGTDLGLELTTSRTWSDRGENIYVSRLGLSVTQALLRGRGVNLNLASLRQARLGTRFSAYELRGFSEALVGEVEETYWDYILADRQIEIFENSLDLAKQQLAETEEIIKVGKLAETEMVAAQAEIALRRQELIDARNVAAANRLRLMRLINPHGPEPWNGNSCSWMNPWCRTWP